MTKFLNISTDNTLGGSSASDETVSSQKAIKEYVDNHGGGGGGAVDSVNGQTGTVVLDAEDVGALPDSTVIPTLNSTTNVLPVRNSASSLTDSQFKQTADGRSIGVFGEPDASTSYDKYFSIKGGRIRTYAGGENSYLFQGYTNGGANSAMIAAIMSGNNDAGAYMTFGCCNGTNSWAGSGVKNSFFFASQKNSSGQALKPLKFIVDANCSGTPQIVIATNKKVGIKTENPSYDLDVSGTINASTDIKVNGTSVLTGITSSDVTTALGYTPYNSTNPSGYQANVIETVKVNGTALTPSSKAVDITVPTNNNQLTNGAGYITSSALSGYQTTITGGATTITSSNLTTSRALISNSSGKVAVSTTTSTELGYVHGVTSAIQTQLNGKVDGNTSITGATKCKITYDSKGLVTAGADLSSSDITTALGYTPYDSSNPNGYTSNVGTVTSVNNVSPVNGNVTLSIPSIDNLANKDLSNLSTTGNSKFQAPLVSGTNIKTVNNQSLLGSGNISIQADPAIDSKSITKNASDQLQTVGVIDQNSTANALKQWSGTKAEYDAIATKDANTLYNITDDTDITLNLLQAIYPVGSIYIGTMSTCPMASLFGTWTLVAQDKVLQGAGTRGSVGSTLNESLPNIVAGNLLHSDLADGIISGSIETTRSTDSNEAKFPNSNRAYATTGVRINASIGSSTYQDNAPVQPDAYLVNIWQRTA